MPSDKGIIVLMGSGELTATMVEVHKDLLTRLTDSPKAVFLDTPAGFQLNVDVISQRAAEYFITRVLHPLSVASFKSSETTTPFDAEQAFHSLREADYILIGPGSPTYAVRQLQRTPVPEILARRIEDGGCLVAASAAALTVGRFTLPVYEIYKVGEDLHWVDGIDILGHFGFNLVVIPHWNNAEGGTHDTRYCFMGEPRFRMLEALLPEEIAIFGLDEHTVCIIDLEKGEAEIRGIGRAVLRRSGTEMIFEKGDHFPLGVLRGGHEEKSWKPKIPKPASSEPETDTMENTFWDGIHRLEESFQDGLQRNDPKDTTSALLELDRTIWKAQSDLENETFISQAREILRDFIVLLGTKLESSPLEKAESIASLVDDLLALRENFRQTKKWREADAIRNLLQRSDIVVEDAPEGSRWRLKSLVKD